MVLLNLFFILALLTIGDAGGEPLEVIPCNEEGTIESSTSVTSSNPTTTRLSSEPPGVCADPTLAPFKRFKGWWCAAMAQVSLPVRGPVSHAASIRSCVSGNLTLSSLETPAEWKNWRKLFQTHLRSVVGVWVAADFNTTTRKYFWSDGQANPTIDPQPKIDFANGKVAWFPAMIMGNNEKPALRVVNPNGTGGPIVNSAICGTPGVQF